MASEEVQTNIRLPSDLKERLVASATENKRSLTAEVVARLEASYGIEPSSWAKAFPSSAASVAGTREANRLIEEAARAAADRDAREAQFVLELHTQLLNLDTQAIQVQRELQMVHTEIDAAEDQRDSDVVSNLLKRSQLLRNHLRAIDTQVVAIKQAIKKAERRQRLADS